MEVEKLENIKLYNADCMEVMKDIPDNSIDLIITDPPYRTISGGNKNVKKHKRKKYCKPL